jgi:hypothetical protein
MAVLLLGLTACGQPPEAAPKPAPRVEPETPVPPEPSPFQAEFARFYQETPAPQPRERREIVTWTGNPKAKRRIGFLELRESRPKGPRWTFIRDAEGMRDLGVVTPDGVFHRIGPKGELTPMGKPPILSAGLKLLFNLPDPAKLDVVDPDPYK